MINASKTVQTSFLFLVTTIVFVGNVWAEKHSASDILYELSQAVKLQNYHGKFVYESEGQSQIYKISHAVISGVEYESISQAESQSSNHIQVGKKSECDSFSSQMFRSLAMAGQEQSINKHYSIIIEGEAKVANRDAWFILMQPKDSDRYSYKLAVDKTSFLPLGTQVLDSTKKALESIKFLELNTDAKFTEADFRVNDNTKVTKVDQPCFNSETMGESQASMSPNWIPEGFTLTSHKAIGATTYQESYSDGMSSFSVFVEKFARPNFEGANDGITSAESHRGATFVLLTSVPKQEYMIYISVVGDIPPEVARKITLSMR